MASVQSSLPTSTLASGPSSHLDSLLLPESIGKRVDPTYSQTLHSRVKELLQTTHNGFPGSQPVYFETKHLAILEQEDYFVCEKSNGIRCLLFFVHSPRGPAAFMLDRNQNWYYIPNLLLPVRGRDNEYLKDTLLDGELLMEKDPSKKTCQYSVFDLMVINGSSVTQRSFNSRLGMLKQDVLAPYKASLLSQTDPTKMPPFRIEHKKMERSYGLPVVFDRMSKLQHNDDGIIWTPVKCPYVPNICDKLLKWKPPEKNTADFRINAKWSKDHKPIYSLDVLSHVTYKFFDHFQPESDWAFEWKDQPPDGKIAEFWYDPKWKVTIVEQGYAPTTRTGGWRFVRFREDKDAANEENDVRKILHSIRDGVSKEQLLGHMQHIRDAWKAREKGLPPPSLSHLQTKGRLSISGSLTTPTGTSPVFPSPAVDSNMYGSGYFYRDHHKSRQNSIDSASTDRRLSATDGSTVMESASHHLEEINDTGPDGTKSLPGSRRQSLESSVKRDNNGNMNDDIERKRHKSLSELDKSRKQQLEDNKRQMKEHLEKAVRNDHATTDAQSISSPSTDDIAKTTSTNFPLKISGPTTAKHTSTPSSPTKSVASSYSLPTVFEEESTKLDSPKANTRLRKTTALGDNGERKLYAEEDDTHDPAINKLQKVEGTTLPSSTSHNSDNEPRNGEHYQADDLASQRPPQTYHDGNGHLESTKPTYTSTTNTTTSRHDPANELVDGRHQSQSGLSARYDPARSSPPPALIPRSPRTTDAQQNKAATPSNRQSTSSHSIHTLLTSSVEPIPPPPAKNVPPSTADSAASHSYKLSTILQEETQQTKSDHGEYLSNEQQQQQKNNQQAQQSRQSQDISGMDRQKTMGMSNSSSPATGPVQFINFHADRPHSKGSPTSRQKNVFIQGEYHNSTGSPSNKVRSPKYTMPQQQPQQQQQQQQQQQNPHPHLHPSHPHHQYQRQQQHQWQQSSGSAVMSPQLVTPPFNKTPTQNSSTKSSPPSSPRGSRSGRQLDTWRVTENSSGYQQMHTPPQYQHHPPPSDYHYDHNYPPPTSSVGYQHISPHGYPSQPHPYSNYNTAMVHSEQHQHPSAQPPPPSDRSYHLHQQSYRVPSEYHVDAPKNQYPNHPRPPPPHPYHAADKQQHYSNYTESHPTPPQSQPPYPTSSNISSAQVTKRKSSKAKLDFILN